MNLLYSIVLLLKDILKNNLKYVNKLIWLFCFIHYLIFTAADQSKVMQEQMSGAAMAMPPDPKAAFKAEWEALEITEHRWALANVEADVLAEKA